MERLFRVCITEQARIYGLGKQNRRAGPSDLTGKQFLGEQNDPAIPDGVQPRPALPCFQRTADRFCLPGGLHSAAKDGALHDLDDHTGILALDPADIHDQSVILQLC